ncbi:MAG: type II secretion system protein [Parcubacteria group bacterium]
MRSYIRSTTRRLREPDTTGGFTLMEVMIVLVFTAITASLVMANINRGKQLQLLRHSAEVFVQDVRTIQNYAAGGRKTNICSDLPWKYIPCPPENCTDYAADSTCGEVPEGGYGIQIQGTLGYNIYADTYIVDDTNPTDGDQRWYSVGGILHDQSTPLLTSTLIPPVRIYAFSFNDSPICTPGLNGTRRFYLYVTFAPPFAEGHVIMSNDGGTTFQQDAEMQNLIVWFALAGDNSRCQQVTISGLTGYVSSDSVQCPQKDQNLSYCKNL